MEFFWVGIPVGLACISSFLCCRWHRPRLQSLETVLIGLVLFFVFLILPVELSATLELLGAIDEISLTSILVLGAIPPLILLAAPKHLLGVNETLPATATNSMLHAFSVLPNYLQLSISIILCSLMVFAVNAALAFNFGWDANSYHLPNAIGWLHDRTLRIPEHHTWRAAMPGNFEVGVMLLFGSGLQRFANGFYFPAFVLAILSVYSIAAWLTRDNVAAALSALLFVSLPMTQFQIFSGYVDLFGTCFLLAGFAVFNLRIEAGRATADPKRYLAIVVVTGLAWGVAVGTKPNFYAFVAIGIVAVTVVMWFERKVHRLSILALLAAMAIAVLLPSYFWFLRAFMATGNPFFPITVELFGFRIFDGYSVNTMMNMPEGWRDALTTFEWIVQSWREYYHETYPYTVSSGLGAVWATFVPLGIIYSAYLAVRGIRQRELRPLLCYMILLVAMFALWWIGLRKLTRFALPWLPIACVLAAPLFGRLARHRSPFFGILLVLTVSTTAVLTTFEPMHSMLGLYKSRIWKRADILAYPTLIDHLPYRTVIWNPRSLTDNFALAGENLTNSVIYRNWKEVGSPADFIREAGVDYVVDKYPYCCAELAKAGATLVLEQKVTQGRKWRIWKINQ